MPDGILPVGWRAALLGSAASVDELSAFGALEEGAPEGSLMLARLDFTEYPSIESLDQLNQVLADAGVQAWPGAGYFAFLAPEGPSIYIGWVKGIAWLPIIAGVLAVTVLPPLLMAFIWWILPESVKTMIEAMLMFGVVFLLLFVMTQFMKPLMAPEKPKKIEEAKA